MTEEKYIQEQPENGGNKMFVTDEQLMAYMEGKLSPEERRAMEELMSDGGPESDAIEGLNMMHAAETKRSVSELHRKLHTDILRNNSRREQKLSGDYWSWIALFTILLLIAVAYVVVRLAS